MILAYKIDPSSNINIYYELDDDIKEKSQGKDFDTNYLSLSYSYQFGDKYNFGLSVSKALSDRDFTSTQTGYRANKIYSFSLGKSF